MNRVAKAEPRFDIDLKYGKEAEERLRRVFKWIADGSSKVEVKRKRMLDFDVYVETHCDYGARGVFVPSGINETASIAYAIDIADTGISIVIDTSLLKDAISDRLPGVRDVDARRGSCPTKGKLIPLVSLLYRLKKGHLKPSEAPVVTESVQVNDGPVDLVALGKAIFGNRL